MKCPQCSFDDDRVLDSRPVQEGAAVRRRRECSNCRQRFTTYEYIERTPLMVTKRDGRREPFDRDKLLSGIMLAVRKRPVSRAAAEELVSAVESSLSESGRIEVTSEEIGEMVLVRLVGIDQVAYIRFASVYRHFDNLEQFVREMETLKEGSRSAAAAGTTTAD
jgi:transcriptional repressor NrdR